MMGETYVVISLYIYTGAIVLNSVCVHQTAGAELPLLCGKMLCLFTSFVSKQLINP